jgi:hypothetical protein
MYRIVYDHMQVLAHLKFYYYSGLNSMKPLDVSITFLFFKPAFFYPSYGSICQSCTIINAWWQFVAVCFVHCRNIQNLPTVEPILKYLWLCFQETLGVQSQCVWCASESCPSSASLWEDSQPPSHVLGQCHRFTLLTTARHQITSKYNGSHPFETISFFKKSFF